MSNECRESYLDWFYQIHSYEKLAKPLYRWAAHFEWQRLQAVTSDWMSHSEMMPHNIHQSQSGFAVRKNPSGQHFDACQF